jgi:uncharacterized protein YoxC
MMKKWFFSNDGVVTSPLNHTEARTYLEDKPNAYGWHPSFSQWKPVSCIPEFTDLVSSPEKSSLVSKELTEKFLAKKLRLETKLSSIEDSINHTASTFSKFEKQISSYKALTQNLSDEVKTAIVDIERKYDGINKKLSQVKNAVNIAEVEMNDAIKGFNNKANSNDVRMPSCDNVARQPFTADTSVDAEREAAQISKAKLAQAKLATPHKRLDTDKKSVEEIVNVTPKVVKQTVAPKSNTKKVIAPDIDFDDKAPKESFNGMKSMMKSVFKGDKKLETETKDEKPMSMAERLRMAQNNG